MGQGVSTLLRPWSSTAAHCSVAALARDPGTSAWRKQRRIRSLHLIIITYPLNATTILPNFICKQELPSPSPTLP